MAWTIRNYNAFLRAARTTYQLNQAQARVMYRGVAERLGRPVLGADLKHHPVVAGQEAKRAPARERAVRAARTRAARVRPPPPVVPPPVVVVPLPRPPVRPPVVVRPPVPVEVVVEPPEWIEDEEEESP